MLATEQSSHPNLSMVGVSSAHRLSMNDESTAPGKTEKRLLGTLHVPRSAHSPTRVDSAERGKKADESHVAKRSRASGRTFARTPANDPSSAQPLRRQLPLGSPGPGCPESAPLDALEG